MFFYQLVYDPNQKSLNADRGEIRVGGKYQADVPTQMLQTDPNDDSKIFIEKKRKKKRFFLRKDSSREDLIWDANGGLTEKQVEQYLIVAR